MRRSAAADLATIHILERHIQAFIPDWPRIVALIDDWRGGRAWPAGGGGDPIGKGGHTDLSDRLVYDAAGNLIGDPCDRISAELGRNLQQMLSAAVAIRAIMTRHLSDPTPTSLCRHGDCPAGNVATSVIRGVPRCSTCKDFWYRSGSSPEDGGDRYERPFPGARPGVDFPEGHDQQQAVA